MSARRDNEQPEIVALRALARALAPLILEELRTIPANSGKEASDEEIDRVLAAAGWERAS